MNDSKKIEATITSMSPLEMGRNYPVPYRRVKLKGTDGRFYMTDLSPQWRNWKRWERLLEVGNKLGNLETMGLKKINGDSFPILLEAAKATHSQPTLGL